MESMNLNVGLKCSPKAGVPGVATGELTCVSASLQLAQPSPTAGRQLLASNRHEDSTDLLFH